jgi:hypothetical protein
MSFASKILKRDRVLTALRHSGVRQALQVEITVEIRVLMCY